MLPGSGGPALNQNGAKITPITFNKQAQCHGDALCKVTCLPPAGSSQEACRRSTSGNRLKAVVESVLLSVLQKDIQEKRTRSSRSAGRGRPRLAHDANPVLR